MFIYEALNIKKFYFCFRAVQFTRRGPCYWWHTCVYTIQGLSGEYDQRSNTIKEKSLSKSKLLSFLNVFFP